MGRCRVLTPFEAFWGTNYLELDSENCCSEKGDSRNVLFVVVGVEFCPRSLKPLLNRTRV